MQRGLRSSLDAQPRTNGNGLVTIHNYQWGRATFPDPLQAGVKGLLKMGLDLEAESKPCRLGVRIAIVPTPPPLLPGHILHTYVYTYILVIEVKLECIANHHNARGRWLPW